MELHPFVHHDAQIPIDDLRRRMIRDLESFLSASIRPPPAPHDATGPPAPIPHPPPDHSPGGRVVVLAPARPA